jgi:transcriptional regulator with PAS, ATPase and Fis domain
MKVDESFPATVLSIIKEHFAFSEDEIAKYGRVLIRSHLKSSLRERHPQHTMLKESLRNALSPISRVTGLIPRLDRALAETETDWKSVRRWIRWVETLPVSLQSTHIHCDASVESLLASPFTKQSERKHDSTVAQVRELNRDCPGNPLKSLFVATRSLSRQDHHDSAIEYLLRIVRYKSLRHLQQRTEAIRELEVILKLDVMNIKRHSRIILQLAKLHVSSGNYEEALAISETQLSRGLSRYALELSLLRTWAMYMTGSTGEAEGELKRITESRGALADKKVALLCIYYKAVFQYLQGNLDAAKVTLSTHRKSGSSWYPDLLYLIMTQQGIIAFSNGNYSTTCELIKEALATRPDTTTTSVAPSYLTLATSQIRLGEFQEAQSNLDTYLSLSAIGKVNRAYLNYSWATGWLFHAKGQTARAIEWYSRASGIAPTTNAKGSILINVADMHLQEGNENSFSDIINRINSIVSMSNDPECKLELDAVTLTWNTLYNDSSDIQELLNHAELLATRGHTYTAATCLFHAMISRSTSSVKQRAKEVWIICKKRIELAECPMYPVVDALISHEGHVDTLLNAFREASELSPHFAGLLILKLAQTHRDKGNTPAQYSYAQQAHSRFSTMNNTVLRDRAQSLMHSSNSVSSLTRHYNTICDTLQELSKEESMLDTLLENIVECTGAERAAIVLEREQHDDYYIPTYKNINASDFADTKAISMSIATNTLLMQMPYVIRDATLDKNSRLYKSVVKYDIRSVLSLPFTTSSNLKGALYLAHHTLKSFFEKSDLDFLNALARFVGVVIGISRHQQAGLGGSDDSQSKLSHIVARDAKMLSLLSRINRLAKRNLPILVTGERGVGKELIARQIHANSERARNSFRAINCASLSPQHLSSELFGVGSKAFSGVNKRLGAIRSVDGGTLFLDEIGDLSLEAQASLLRALEYQEITPLGSDTIFQTDVRFLYGTNQNLEEKIEQGSFRADFFDRIAVIEIKVPPLRERVEDVNALIDHFAQLADLGLPDGTANFSPQARHALTAYEWPGNVRELQNTVAYLSSLDVRGPIQLSDLPANILSRVQKKPSNYGPEMSKEFYRKLLVAHNGNVAKVARVLDISYNTLRSRLLKNGLI